MFFRLSNNQSDKNQVLIDKEEQEIASYPSSVNQTILTKKIPSESNLKRSTADDDSRNLEDPTMPCIEKISCPKRIMRNLAEPGFNIWNLDRDGMVEHIE